MFDEEDADLGVIVPNGVSEEMVARAMIDAFADDR